MELIDTKFCPIRSHNNACNNWFIFSIIANRVGAESYENFSDDNMLNFKYEGTIRRQSGDLLRIDINNFMAIFPSHLNDQICTENANI